MYPALLLAASVAAASQTNLDFSTGKLTGWEGKGFAVVPLGSGYVASSSETTEQAVLHQTFTLPTTASFVTFSAALIRPDGTPPRAMLDVVLEAAAREFAPRQRRTADGWEDAPQLLPPDNRRLRDYRWNVEKFAGRRVRIALIDSDERPGCHLLATGFTIETRDENNLRRFSHDMLTLQKTHGLAKMMRYDSRHFTALSNAPAIDSENRLKNCEALYQEFFEHFRKRGFVVKPPVEKMMVALFNTQAGFDAYVGQPLGSSVSGLYHLPTNRLVIYDYGTNQAFLDGKKRFERAAQSAASDLERQHRTVTLGRRVRDHREDTNVSTVMHEAAHQLSFNCGLLNSRGSAPLWLVEGLAVYCEATKNGVWQGIGEPNAHRIQPIVRQLRAKKGLYSLHTLVRGDDWLRKATLVDEALLGYSQSWLLFRLLIEERPRQLKAYLETIYERKTPDHRLTDFLTAFGDLKSLETRYLAYVGEIVRRESSEQP